MYPKNNNHFFRYIDCTINPGLHFKLIDLNAKKHQKITYSIF